MDQTELTRVMTNAVKASEAISALTVKERVVFIKNLREYISDHQEEIMTAIQKETRKCRTDALVSEIFPILDHLHYLEKYAAAALKPETVPTPFALMGKKSQIFYEPMGVILVISPWNYPFFQAIIPIANAFAAGNAVIYKPSELTPLKGLVEKTLEKCGFNPYWAQVVYGDGATGKSLIDAKPQKVFFTGSVPTGIKIMEQAAKYLIPVELELGGKDPMIVFEDANLARTSKAAVWGAFTNAGQSCTSVEKLFIHESIYEAMKEKLITETSLMKIAVDTNGDSDMGEMTSPLQVKKISAMVEDAKKKGAKILTGGHWNGSSTLIPPMILENTTDDMLLNQDEIFGPLLPIFKFKTEEEVLEKCNNSSYGLSASVWTADKKRALRVTRNLQTGNVSINNVMLTEGNPALPFGGVKNSGIGRYKGIQGLRSLTQPKSVLFDQNSSKIEANWYPYDLKKYGLFKGLMAALFRPTFTWLMDFAVNGLQLESHSAKAKRTK